MEATSVATAPSPSPSPSPALSPPSPARSQRPVAASATDGATDSTPSTGTATTATTATESSDSTAMATVTTSQTQESMENEAPSLAVKTGNNSDTASGAEMPPTTVNAAMASAAMIASSAMTPTTTNYGMNATLTPMGEDKVSTAGPAATQKVKQTKKKAAADGETGAKKSPRVRAHQPKADKRKASPSRGNAGNGTPTNAAAAAVAAAAATSASMSSPFVVANPTYASMSDNSGLGAQQELPPAQDTELRKQFLQRIYRQLQMTHRNQDDTMVRRLATNIEIDICRRATDRANYTALMNQQIHSLMQAELANGSVGLQSSLYVPGSQGAPSSMTMNGSVQTSSGMAVSSEAAYRHSSTGVPTSGDAAQRTSSSSQGSFMSLLSSQAPVQSYDGNRAPQQQYATTQGLPAQARPPQYAAMGNAPGYSAQSQTMAGTSAGVKAENISAPDQANPYANQRPPAAQSSTCAPPEFALQFQRLDRNGLVDLLWTQHKTVLQYQRRLAQLEVQLNTRQAGMAGPAAPMAGATGVPSGYYNASPRQPTGQTGVPASTTAEAETQRANDRRNSRVAQQQQQQHQQQPSPYDQSQYQANQPPATPTSGVNPTLYWEKVRYLKEGYLKPLYIAHQALSVHTAPPNSVQNQKAENVKHNISLACSILSEAPQSAQPRPLEVLDSIERFIQSTVVPIVRKVGPGLYPPMPTTSEAPPSHQAYAQQVPKEYQDQSRNSISAPPPVSTQSTAPAASSANDVQVPSAAPAAPAGKGAAKAGGAKATPKSGGRKSPSTSAKKAATPKTITPKAAKPPAKKRASKATKAEQQSDAMSSEAIPQMQAAPVESSVKAEAYDDPLKDRVELPSLNSGQMTDDDSLNDFSDFADLDFGDDLDPLTKVQGNKENATGINARKRSIEDV